MKIIINKIYNMWYSYDKSHFGGIAEYLIIVKDRFTGRLINHKLQIRNKGIHPLSA